MRGLKGAPVIRQPLKNTNQIQSEEVKKVKMKPSVRRSQKSDS